MSIRKISVSSVYCVSSVNCDVFYAYEGQGHG